MVRNDIRRIRIVDAVENNEWIADFIRENHFNNAEEAHDFNTRLNSIFKIVNAALSLKETKLFDVVLTEIQKDFENFCNDYPFFFKTLLSAMTVNLEVEIQKLLTDSLNERYDEIVKEILVEPITKDNFIFYIEDKDNIVDDFKLKNFSTTTTTFTPSELKDMIVFILEELRQAANGDTNSSAAKTLMDILPNTFIIRKTKQMTLMDLYNELEKSNEEQFYFLELLLRGEI